MRAILTPDSGVEPVVTAREKAGDDYLTG